MTDRVSGFLPETPKRDSQMSLVSRTGWRLTDRWEERPAHGFWSWTSIQRSQGTTSSAYPLVLEMMEEIGHIPLVCI
jgi:hypothetical protein